MVNFASCINTSLQSRILYRIYVGFQLHVHCIHDGNHLQILFKCLGIFCCAFFLQPGSFRWRSSSVCWFRARRLRKSNKTPSSKLAIAKQSSFLAREHKIVRPTNIQHEQRSMIFISYETNHFFSSFFGIINIFSSRNPYFSEKVVNLSHKCISFSN